MITRARNAQLDALRWAVDEARINFADTAESHRRSLSDPSKTAWGTMVLDSINAMREAYVRLIAAERDEMDKHIIDRKW